MNFLIWSTTSQVIRTVWQDHHYLIDPHTAVAYQVMEEYRKASGDTRKTVFVSTASPFKFCDSVLRALGEETDAPGTVLLEQLTAKTGVPAPAPLAALKNKAVRFTECVEKTEMLPAVDAFVR